MPRAHATPSPRARRRHGDATSRSARVDSQYHEAATRKNDTRMSLLKASKLLAEAKTPTDLAAAADLFTTVIQQDPGSVRARSGFKMAGARIIAAERSIKEETLKFKKIALLKLRYGDEGWREAMLVEQKLTVDELRNIFELLDADGSGTLDREEFTELASYFSTQPLTEAQVEAAMSQIDYDGSGLIDFEELCSWFLTDAVQKNL